MLNVIFLDDGLNTLERWNKLVFKVILNYLI